MSSIGQLRSRRKDSEVANKERQHLIECVGPRWPHHDDDVHRGGESGNRPLACREKITAQAFPRKLDRVIEHPDGSNNYHIGPPSARGFCIQAVELLTKVVYRQSRPPRKGNPQRYAWYRKFL